MPAPSSAKPLPAQTPNSSAPIASGAIELGGELKDSLGKPVTGRVIFFASVTEAWRYLFGTFAQTTSDINPNFSLSVSNPPTQAEVEALVVQVQLLSKQLGRTN